MYPFRICGDVVGKKINFVPEYCPRLKGFNQRSWTQTGVQKKVILLPLTIIEDYKE